MLEHTGKNKISDYDCYKYTYSKKNTQINDTYYTNLEGSFNLTTIRKHPLIITAPYFKNRFFFINNYHSKVELSQEIA